MPELNIFKIYYNQKQNLIDLLQTKNILFSQTQKIKYNSGTYSLDLYFSVAPAKIKLKWVSEIKKIFTLQDVFQEHYSAVILTEINKNVYAISYGLGHFYISRFSDYDYGINFGCRILKDYKIKNSREFGGITRKSILTYNNAAEITFDGGESVSYIRGTPYDEAEWGKTVSCGQSIKLRKRELDIISIPEILIKIENIINTNPVIKDIPRSLKVKDKSVQSKLLNDLVDSIKNRKFMVSISQQQLVGVDFQFSDKFTYFINYKSNLIELDESDPVKTIDNIIKNNPQLSYKDILELDVEAYEDNSKFCFKNKLLRFIDYIDSKNNYYLDEGVWYQFDINYLKQLKESVDKIPIDLNPEISEFDEQQYQNWLKTNKYSEKKWYREKYLNHILEQNYSYENYDRDPLYENKTTIEFTDLLKEKEFTFVKIGTPQKLNYVIDQSINTLRYLQNNNFEIKKNKKSIKINSLCLWIFLSKKKTINNLSELNSIIFLIKLAQWRKEVLLAGLNLIVKISYKR